MPAWFAFFLACYAVYLNCGALVLMATLVAVPVLVAAFFGGLILFCNVANWLGRVR